MGLSFQNKKSWHPGSFKNIAEVWAAEEKKTQLEKYWQEIKKKRIEEKYSEELKKLQVEAGILPESALNSMEWMYKGCEVSDQKNNAEEYLLGKPLEEKKPDFATPNGQPDADGKNRFTGFKDDVLNQQNEDFIKVREDPQFEMRKEEMKRKEEIMNNPMIMQGLYKSQEEESRQMSSKEKKSKKDKKSKSKKSKSEKKSKHRKSEKSSKRDKKKKHSKRQGSSEEDSERNDSRSRSRSRSPISESDRSSVDSERRHRSLSKSKKRKEKSHKKEHKHKSKSAERKISEEKPDEENNQLFNEYIRNRLGPLVHFDDESYRLTFLARKKFKDNDQRAMQPEDREKMQEMMRKNANDYREQQTSILSKTKDADDTAVADFDKKRNRSHNELAYGMHTEVNQNSQGDNINRSKYFVDKKVLRENC